MLAPRGAVGLLGWTPPPSMMHLRPARLPSPCDPTALARRQLDGSRCTGEEGWRVHARERGAGRGGGNRSCGVGGSGARPGHAGGGMPRVTLQGRRPVSHCLCARTVTRPGAYSSQLPGCVAAVLYSPARGGMSHVCALAASGAGMGKFCGLRCMLAAACLPMLRPLHMCV